jgi:hypothetical protein
MIFSFRNPLEGEARMRVLYVYCHPLPEGLFLT